MTVFEILIRGIHVCTPHPTPQRASMKYTPRTSKICFYYFNIRPFLAVQRNQKADGTMNPMNKSLFGNQAPVVQTLDSAIHRINHYPGDKGQENQLYYPLDRDLSKGQHYPAFEQQRPDCVICQKEVDNHYLNFEHLG